MTWEPRWTWSETLTSSAMAENLSSLQEVFREGSARNKLRIGLQTHFPLPHSQLAGSWQDKNKNQFPFLCTRLDSTTTRLAAMPSSLGFVAPYWMFFAKFMAESSLRSRAAGALYVWGVVIHHGRIYNSHTLTWLDRARDKKKAFSRLFQHFTCRFPVFKKRQENFVLHNSQANLDCEKVEVDFWGSWSIEVRSVWKFLSHF